MITKIKKWWRGKHIQHSLETIVAAKRLGIDLNHNLYKSPFIAKIINPFLFFWLRNWKWIIGYISTTVLSVIGLYLVWLQIIKPK